MVALGSEFFFFCFVTVVVHRLKRKTINLTNADLLIDVWVSPTHLPLSVTDSATVTHDSVFDLYKAKTSK